VLLLFFFLILAVWWFFANSYSYASETIGGKIRVLFLPISLIFFGLGAVWINILAIWFNDYRVFIWIINISSFLFSLGYFALLESPFFFYKQRNIEKLYQCLSTLIKRNFPKDEVPEITSKLQKILKYGEYFETNQENNQKNNYNNSSKLSLTDVETRLPTENNISKLSTENSFSTEKHSLPNELNQLLIDKPSPSPKEKSPGLKAFFTKNNLSKFFKMFSLMLMIQVTFTLSTLINDSLGISNIFFSGALISTFQTLGYLSPTLFVNRVGRKSINLYCSSVTFLTGMSILVIDIVSNLYVHYEERSNGVRLMETSKIY
jgi:hypothetical protein